MYDVLYLFACIDIWLFIIISSGDRIKTTAAHTCARTLCAGSSDALESVLRPCCVKLRVDLYVSRGAALKRYSYVGGKEFGQDLGTKLLYKISTIK